MTAYKPIFRSPIAGPGLATASGLRVQDLTGVPVTLIQGEAEEVLQKHFDRLPATPGDVVDVGQGFLARLTPAEFYLFGRSAEANLPAAAALEERGTQANRPVHTTDYTHGRAVLELSGTDAAEVLRKICGLDFHESTFANMQVKQTGAAKIKTLIARCDENGRPAYQLHVNRPFGQYFWDILGDAGQEFGLGV